MSRRGIQKHKGKILFSGLALTAFVTTSMCALLFIKNWLNEQKLRIQEQHFAKEQIKRRFNQVQRDALYTMTQLMPVLALVLNREMNLEVIVSTLKSKKSSKKTPPVTIRDGPDVEDASSISNASIGDLGVESLSSTPSKSKAELWQDLKDESLVKLLTTVYTTCMLLLLTRLQLNILARKEYLDTAIRVAVSKEAEKSNILSDWASSIWNGAVGMLKPNNGGDTAEAQETKERLDKEKEDAARVRSVNEQAFLSHSWWLLNSGWPQFKPVIEEQVRNNFGHLSPREVLSLEQFGLILSQTIHKINRELLDNQFSTVLLRSFLPAAEMQNSVLEATLDDAAAMRIVREDGTILRQLVDETARCLQSTATFIVLEGLVNESFQYIMQLLETKVTAKSKKAPYTEARPSTQTIESSQSVFQLALYALSLKDCCEEMSKHELAGASSEYLRRLDSVSDLDDLSASVYSNFGF